MKQIVVPLGGAIGVKRSALFPSILEEGCVNVLVILENIKFVILFHAGLHSAALRAAYAIGKTRCEVRVS